MFMNLLTTSFVLFSAIIISSLFPFNHHLINFFQHTSPLNKNSIIENNKPSNLLETIIPVAYGAVGPESFAFDRAGGGPYTGVSDGRIIKWIANESRWIDFAFTSPERDGCGDLMNSISREHICGRPLGLKFNEETGDLYIADAYMGLLVVRPNGGVATQVATQAQGIPFGFTNSLDIDKRTGIIYFTDSSTRYQRRNHLSVLISGDNSGRLMKFDPESKQVTILLNDLKFPNGVALSENGEFLLVAETTTCKILKVWLQKERNNNVEVIEELPGFPDNIKRNDKGEFWVGINSKRGKILKWALSNTWLQKNVLKLPFDSTKAHSYLDESPGSGMGIRLNKNGNVVEIIEGGWKHVSEVEEKYGSLWVGSVKRPFAIKMQISK